MGEGNVERDAPSWWKKSRLMARKILLHYNFPPRHFSCCCLFPKRWHFTLYTSQKQRQRQKFLCRKHKFKRSGRRRVSCFIFIKNAFSWESLNWKIHPGTLFVQAPFLTTFFFPHFLSCNSCRIKSPSDRTSRLIHQVGQWNHADLQAPAGTARPGHHILVQGWVQSCHMLHRQLIHLSYLKLFHKQEAI